MNSTKDNKQVAIQSISHIKIDTFRNLKDRIINLGSRITVFVGRNGTMKTSLMGLIAHPFSHTAEDVFGYQLKTKLSDIFKLSAKHDTSKYGYSITLNTTETKTTHTTKVSIYYVAENTNRHRIVVGGSKKGDGNFSYCTSFLNLKRLLPMANTNAKESENKASFLTEQEKRQQQDFYERIFPSNVYDTFIPIQEKNIKKTFAPSGDKATYDFNSISSGEDNLGAIFNTLIGFQRAYNKNSKAGGGVLCIDEFDSSLHPSAQVQLFNYLYEWSYKYKVQIIISTHSLHLIQQIYTKKQPSLNNKEIILNFISTAFTSSDNNHTIVENPSYAQAYEELTLEKPENLLDGYKVNVFCEDKIAETFIKKILKNRKILSRLNFQSNIKGDLNNPGTPYTSLVNLCANFSTLLNDSIVVFDPDITNTHTAKIKNFDHYFIIPDEENLAIERRLIAYLLSLNRDDPFFIKHNISKEQIRLSLKNSNISSLNINDIKDEQKTNISDCKTWVHNISNATFHKYLTFYINAHPKLFAEFVGNIKKAINRILTSKGIPPLE